jgi:TPR repeat protein
MYSDIDPQPMDIDYDILNDIKANKHKEACSKLTCLVGQLFSEETEKNEKLAFDYYQISSNLGFESGTYYVGYCYQIGIGVKKNNRKALEYYQRVNPEGKFKDLSGRIDTCKNEFENEKQYFSSLLNSKKSSDLNKLGKLYEYGIGTKEDKQKAFEYYQEAAEQSNLDALNNVGRCYENGIGVEKNEKKAFEYYESAAVMKHPKGILNYIRCYDRGVGILKNEELAKVMKNNMNL